MSHTFNVQITLSLVQLNHGGVEGLFLLNLWQSRLIFHCEVISISIFLALVHLQQGGGVELQIKPRNRTKNYWTIRFIDLQYACLTWSRAGKCRVNLMYANQVSHFFRLQISVADPNLSQLELFSWIWIRPLVFSSFWLVLKKLTKIIKH